MKEFILKIKAKVHNLMSRVVEMQEKNLKELCHGVFIYFSDLTKLFSH